MVGYATGQTDEWRGTGVWSGLSLKRENDDDNSNSKKDSSKSKEPAKELAGPSK